MLRSGYFVDRLGGIIVEALLLLALVLFSSSFLYR